MLLANMEQWRWMPDDLGDYHVWVNIPEFTSAWCEDGKVIHAERIVVGKADSQTPVFSDEMEHVIFHPFWGVPDFDQAHELQPNLAARQRHSRPPTSARSVSRPRRRSRAIDWRATDMRNFHVYQPPGRDNVLGVVKFRFPNKHDVYMHDTPQKHLFYAHRAHVQSRLHARARSQ